MKRISQPAILLVLLIGGIMLSSCGKTIEKDIMTPGGLIEGTGGGGKTNNQLQDEYIRYEQDEDL